MDFKKIRYTIETEFHLLRHFSKVSDTFTNRLIQAGYTQAQLAEVLSLPGSRFHNTFAVEIPELLSHVENAQLSQHTGVNGNIIITAFFSKEMYIHGVGTIAIIPYSELESGDQKKVYLAENRGFLLKHLDVKELPNTYHLTLILNQSEAGYTLLTAFPGPAALPFPNNQMNKVTYKECATFWNHHVFLVKKNQID